MTPNPKWSPRVRKVPGAVIHSATILDMPERKQGKRVVTVKPERVPFYRSGNFWIGAVSIAACFALAWGMR